MHGHVTPLAALAAILLLAPLANAAGRRGTPVTGARGVQRTTAQLEAAARQAPPRPPQTLPVRRGPATKRAAPTTPTPAPGAAVGAPRVAVSSGFSFDGH